MSSLSSEYAVDQALLDENKKIVALRFDVSANFKSQSIDFEFAKKISKLKKYFTIFSIDTKQVSNFNLMYELFESSAYFLFFKNKKIMIDQGTGNNNKLETNSLIQAKLLKILEIAIKNIKKGKNFFFLE